MVGESVINRKIRKHRSLLVFTVIFVLLASTAVAINLFYSRPQQGQQPIESAKDTADFSIQIPKINIEAPIILEVDATNKAQYFKALEGGVAHMKGSVLPGQVGNSFIFGHSSFYESSAGSYKEIFKNLNDLERGDDILISANNQKIIFVVEDKKIVKPDDLSVLANSDTSILTISTCWPVGRTDSRLIIKAKREN